MRSVLGLDEAGRGSVLGPLVIGGFSIDDHRIFRLADLGVRDSKLLPSERREEIYAELRTLGDCRTVHLGPARIDTAVAKHGLNDLEITAFAELVRAVGPDETRADACDPNARRFARVLKARSGHPAPVKARHHMDRDDLVVGAASIVAKVERDRAVERLAAEIGEPIGSGYPSDPRTMEFVRRWIASRGVQSAAWLRQSWAPTKRLIHERSARRLEEFDG